MVETEKTHSGKFAEAEQMILSPLEIEAGFTIIEEFINESRTPVPEHCFVRYGYIVQRAMDMSTKHNYMILQLYNLISKHLISNGIKNAKDFIFFENRLNTSVLAEPVERDETLPDIAVYPSVISGDRGSIPHGSVPLLVIEILSQTTALIDLTEKKAKFRRMGVKNYWCLKKSDNQNDGLEQSYFFKLKGDKFLDISVDFQESGILTCAEIYYLSINAQDIWNADPLRDTNYQWQEAEARAEQEKTRAEQEKTRAEQEKARADALQKELDILRKK